MSAAGLDGPGAGGAAAQARDAIAEGEFFGGPRAHREHLALTLLAAVPDDGDPRTIAERLEDGAVAERAAVLLHDELASLSLYLTNHGFRWSDTPGPASGSRPTLRAKDPEAADLLDRLTADARRGGHGTGGSGA